jgi:hypothetical protein
LLPRLLYIKCNVFSDPCPFFDLWLTDSERKRFIEVKDKNGIMSLMIIVVVLVAIIVEGIIVIDICIIVVTVISTVTIIVVVVIINIVIVS